MIFGIATRCLCVRKHIDSRVIPNKFSEIAIPWELIFVVQGVLQYYLRIEIIYSEK